MAFEKFTGGGGDADLDPDASNYVRKKQQHYKGRMDGARKAGLEIGGLSPRALDDWYGNGWYTLFHDR